MIKSWTENIYLLFVNRQTYLRKKECTLIGKRALFK